MAERLVHTRTTRSGSQEFAAQALARKSFVAFLPRNVAVEELGLIDLEECQPFDDDGSPSPRHGIPKENDDLERKSRVYFREITEVIEEMPVIQEDSGLRPALALTTVRVLQPVRRTQRISTEKSLASQVFGKGSRTEAWLFHYIAKNRLSSSVLWLLWYAGLVVGLLGLANVLPVEWTCGSMLMLPLPLLNALVLSVDLVREVSNEFEAKVLWFLQGLMFSCGFFSLDDERKVFWMSLAPAMYFSLLVDAYPAKFRGFFTKMFFVSKALALVSWDVLVLTGWGHFTNTGWTLGRLHGATVATSFTTSITLLIFCYRHLKTAWTQNDRCVIIKSAVRTFHAEVELEVQSVDGVDVPTGFRLIHQQDDNRLSIANPEEVADVKIRGPDGRKLSGTAEGDASMELGGNLGRFRLQYTKTGTALNLGEAKVDDANGTGSTPDRGSPSRELDISPQEGRARQVRSRDSSRQSWSRGRQ